jgi:hypothetical protein
MGKMKFDIEKPLSEEQRSEYAVLKREILVEIQVALRAFQRAGERLLKIRDDRLYREEYRTFEEFCREVLGQGYRYANRLILGYELCQDLVAQGISYVPDSERQARELAKYPRDMLKLIIQRAEQLAGRRKVTYKTIRDAAKNIVVSPKVRLIWVGQFRYAAHLQEEIDSELGL